MLPDWLAILVVFLTKGLCDFFGNYLVNYVGVSAVTDLETATRASDMVVTCTPSRTPILRAGADKVISETR